MKTFVLSLTIMTGLAATTIAATNVDANGDGLLTMAEVTTAFPDINAEAFSTMDVNADGVLDTEEVAAAQQAGLLPQG